VFLLEVGKTKTLFLGFLFLGREEVLDLKTPLLRSLTALNEKLINL
jgi:glutamine synthetase type III